jgi:TorA maturation chaperone TorD
MTEPVAMQFVPPVSPEDESRANLYGLLARLFYAPPDANLLTELRQAAPPPEEGDGLTAEGAALKTAWADLVAACASAFPARLEEEHFQVFVGVGKAEVTPYMSAYMQRLDGDNPLVRLRGQLADWGLARREGAAEPEDHVSALCETMRWLIVRRKAPLEVQRRLFEDYLYAPGARFCSAVTACEDAKFYRYVAQLLRTLLEVERNAFDIE